MNRTVGMERPEDWVEQVRSIKRFARGDRRAPYKPLLLLWLIGRQAAGLPTRVSFREAEDDLTRLMDKFRLGVSLRVTYPFVYLGTNRDLWQVETINGEDVTKMPQAVKESRPFLLEQEVTGALAPDFERALHRTQVRSRVVNALLEMEFPETLHREILEEVRLGQWVIPVPSPRDPRFKHTVLLAYQNRCSFCGFDGSLKGAPVAIDAAHIKMRSHRGPDHITNGLALCVFHHRLFDRGALGLDQDLRILVSQHMTVHPTEIRMPVMELIGEPVLRPQAGYDPPSVSYVNWHYWNLFVRPRRKPLLRGTRTRLPTASTPD